MEIVTQVTELLQGLLEESMDVLARETGCVKRERKFSGSTLLSTLVLTVLQNPKPKASGLSDHGRATRRGRDGKCDHPTFYAGVGEVSRSGVEAACSTTC